jgi:hypothetical protein
LLRITVCSFRGAFGDKWSYTSRDADALGCRYCVKLVILVVVAVVTKITG